MSYNSHNIGRKLYVSVNGDNSSAKIGDPTRPWRTPQDARDVALDGDFIHVFPGTYSYGDQGSGADYEGTDNVDTQLDNQEVALNYGKSDINYHFELGVIMNGISTGNKALFFEPWGVAIETPSTMKVTGYLKVTTLADFIQIIYRESEWDIEFSEVDSARGLAIEANYDSVGGIQDISWVKSLKLRGEYLNTSARSFACAQTGSTLASNGRVGYSRGLININIDRVYSPDTFKIGWFYNYDIFIKIGHLKYSWGQLNAFKDTIFHMDIGVLETFDDGQGGLEDISGSTDAELYINIGKIKRHVDATAHYAGIHISNRYATGGKIFINVDSLTSDDCIVVNHQASPDSRATLHNNGHLGETEVTISGNFYEENVASPVLDIAGTLFATGANGHQLIKLKNASLIHLAAGTDSIDAANAGEDVIIQNVISNLSVNANVDEIGESVLVDAGYTH